MLQLKALVVVMALAAAAPASELAPTGTLRAVFLAGNPVQGRLDAKTGAVTVPVGDLVPELARRLGVPYRIIPAPDAAGVIASIKRHEADIGFLAYEAARATQVEFSKPYLLMGNAYLVRADSTITRSADVDRAGVTIGAVKGQSQQIYVSDNIKTAKIDVMPEVPPADGIVDLLVSGKIDAFAANRQRMEDVARASSKVRVLSDNFSVIGQALVVDKGDASRLTELNRLLTDVLASGLVKSSIERAKIAGVEVAP